MKAQDLIASSLRLIGVLASGETPSSAESSDALAILNDMVDSWQNERLMIFTTGRQEFPLIAAKQVYTLGPGGDFNVDPRPVRVSQAGVIFLGNPLQPLELPLELLTVEQWAAIPVKSTQSALPLSLYDDGSFPLRALSYYPVPNIGLNTALYTWSALSKFADLATNYEFPPGYAKALRYNLATDLAPEFGRSLPIEVAAQATLSRAALKSINSPLVDLRVDAALVGAPGTRIYNWRSDTYGRGSR